MMHLAGQFISRITVLFEVLSADIPNSPRFAGLKQGTLSSERTSNRTVLGAYRCELLYILTSVVILIIEAPGFCGAPRTIPTIVKTIAHDPSAFTQGLLFYKGLLYESTGLNGHSSLRCVDPLDGRVLKNIPVADIFAEGLALMDKELVQLTWQEKTALIYTLPDLTQSGYFTYEGEGWGLTADSASFLMSNGSDTLYWRSKKFALVKKIPVTLDGKPVKNLNELEYVNGTVYANIWYDNNIVAISAKTGIVQKVIDCSELTRRAQLQSGGDVLNGIAYNPATKTFFVTGKNWRFMFEVFW
jgi:glutaminyl-peptide cyclotransferase